MTFVASYLYSVPSTRHTWSFFLCFLFADQVIEEFRGHHEGTDPSPKLINNVSSKIFRIKNFVAYLSAGQTDLASMTFINNAAKMQSWILFLRQAKISEPKIHPYLKNVARFLQFVNETPPPTCRLSCFALFGLRREIRSMIHPVRRSMAVHQVAVKQAKEGHLISKATLRACQEAAKKRIPEILSKFSSPLACHSLASHVPLNASLFFCAYCLKTAVEKKDQWSFYGHLTAYWASIY